MYPFIYARGICSAGTVMLLRGISARTVVISLLRPYLSLTDHRIYAWGHHAVLETQQLGSRTNLRYLLLTVLHHFSRVGLPLERGMLVQNIFFYTLRHYLFVFFRVSFHTGLHRSSLCTTADDTTPWGVEPVSKHTGGRLCSSRICKQTTGFPRDLVDTNHTTSLLPVALLTGSCHCPRGIKLKGEFRLKAKGQGPRAKPPIFSSGIHEADSASTPRRATIPRTGGQSAHDRQVDATFLIRRVSSRSWGPFPTFWLASFSSALCWSSPILLQDSSGRHLHYGIGAFWDRSLTACIQHGYSPVRARRV